MDSSPGAYILRIFARKSGAPSPQAIGDHLRSRRFAVRIESGAVSQHSEGWTRLRVFYAPGRSPLGLERQSLHGDAPLSEPLRALMDATADAKDSRGKGKVLAFLGECRQVFELSVPPEYDWHAGRHLVTTELLDYLRQATDGMVQADGEGYYERNRVILKL